MLLLTFTGITITYKQVNRLHLQACVLVIVLSLAHYAWVRWLFPDLAMVGFVLGATPTAAAAAVVANMMKLNVPFVTVATVISNMVSVIYIPLMLPVLIQEPLTVSPYYIVLDVFIILGLPLLAGQFITRKKPKLTDTLAKFKPVAFGLFIFNMLIASANGSDYIRSNADISVNTVVLIAAITFAIGFINYKVGEWTAPKALKYETGLATGRKNTMFALWLSITYVNPMIGLAPVFYLVFHNLYNSVQLWFLERKRQNATVENRH